MKVIIFMRNCKVGSLRSVTLLSNISALTDKYFRDSYTLPYSVVNLPFCPGQFPDRKSLFGSVSSSLCGMRSLFCEEEVLAVYLCPDGHSVFVIDLPIDRHILANKIAVSRMSKRLEKGFESYDFHAYRKMNQVLFLGHCL